MSYTLQNSTFLDAFGANLYTDAQYQQVVNGNIAPLLDLFQYGKTAATLSSPSSALHVTVGLVLDHGADPASLLSGNWAQRQTGLAAYSTPDALWAQYGAGAALYSTTSSQVAGVVGSAALTEAASQGFASSAADRTIWVSLDASQFKALFGQDLQVINTLKVSTTQGVTPTSYAAWTGNLQLNDAIAPGVVKGVWVDSMVAINNPAVLASTPVSLPVGPLGIGNATTQGVGDIAGVAAVDATPAALAAQYHFPLPAGTATAPIALVESDGFGSPGALFAAYNLYRQQLGLAPVTQSQFQILGHNGNNAIPSNELTLDISVVAGAAPNSGQLLYSFGATPFSAYQQAFFDSTNHPAVLSSSWGISGQTTPNSPFAWAFQQLMTDGALANVSVHRAAGDWGSNGSIGNGISNIPSDHSSGYDLLVGGTSLVSLSSALSDPTLQTLLQAALHDDRATVFPLVAAGLRELPSHLDIAAPGPVGAATTFTKLFETVWQSMLVTPGDTASEVRANYGAHDTGTGGISSTTPLPSYQQAFGLGGLTGGGRGVPDVAALAGGDTLYSVLDFNYVNGLAALPLIGDGGTSAASPLWASLTTQFNVIFHDQGLPNLGYYNDLIYIAAAIAPGSFNDIQLGNNISGFYAVPGHTGVFDPLLTLDVVPTGHGFSAGAGYDLVSGLGSPNGTLLARALSAIAHQQMSFSTSPPLLDDDGHGGWTSGTKQDLLLQTSTVDGATVGVDIGSHNDGFRQRGHGPLRLDQPAGAAVAAARLRPRPGAAVRQAGAGHGDVVARGRGRQPRRPHGRRHRSGAAGRAHQSVRLRRLLLGRRRAARVARGGGGRDGGRRQRRAGRGAAAPGRREQPAGHLLQGRRHGGHDRRARARRGGLRRGGAGPGLPDHVGRHRDHRRGLRPGERGAAAARQCRRHRRHAARQPHDRRLLLGLHQRQRGGRRPEGRPSLELRPEHLGVGGHVRRRRPRLQRPGRAARLHQRPRARLAGVGGRRGSAPCLSRRPPSPSVPSACGRRCWRRR